MKVTEFWSQTETTKWLTTALTELSLPAITWTWRNSRIQAVSASWRWWSSSCSLTFWFIWIQIIIIWCAFFTWCWWAMPRNASRLWRWLRNYQVFFLKIASRSSVDNIKNIKFNWVAMQSKPQQKNWKVPPRLFLNITTILFVDINPTIAHWFQNTDPGKKIQEHQLDVKKVYTFWIKKWKTTNSFLQKGN